MGWETRLQQQSTSQKRQFYVKLGLERRPPRDRVHALQCFHVLPRLLHPWGPGQMLHLFLVSAGFAKPGLGKASMDFVWNSAPEGVKNHLGFPLRKGTENQVLPSPQVPLDLALLYNTPMALVYAPQVPGEGRTD